MNPELSHIAARCHYQERLRAAECAHRMPRAQRSSGLGRAIASMRFSRRYRALAFRTAAVS